MEQYEAFKKVREAQAKGDLIGSIHNSEVYELLGFHRVATVGEKESWAAFSEALGNAAAGVPANTRNDVSHKRQQAYNHIGRMKGICRGGAHAFSFWLNV